MSYDPGSVVWVKLKGGGRIWWVGQVTNDYPEDLLDGHRTDPLAVVKFFSDDTEFEVVKKPAEIVEYNCPKKEEFIRKGKLHLAKDKSTLNKFVSDCKEAETLTGGTVDFIDSLDTAPTTPKKPPAYAGLFKPTPSPQKSAHEYAGLVKLNFKKLASPSKKSSPSTTVEGRKYNCDQCSFTTDRLNAFTSHRKTHAPGSSHTSSPPESSPTQAKSPAKSASPEKTPKKSSPVKATAGRRGKKRKAAVETTPAVPAADKQDILADWSDAEGSADSPHPEEDLEPKKPRTDKELSDAFESLLKTTKPPQVGEKSESTEEPIADEPSDVEEDFELKQEADESPEDGKEEDVEQKVPKAEESETLEVEKTEIDVKVEEKVEFEEPANTQSAAETPKLELTETLEDSEKVSEVTSEDKDAAPGAVKEETSENVENVEETSPEIVQETPEVTEKVSEVLGSTVESVAAAETSALITESELRPDTPVSETVPEPALDSQEDILTQVVVSAEEVQKIDSDTLLILDDPGPTPIVEAVKSSPTAKVLGVTKAAPQPEKIEQTPTTLDTSNLDDADQLQYEVDALLAATKPVDISHQQLFSTRPDLQFKVSPTQLKSNPVSAAPSTQKPPLQKIVTVSVPKTSPIQPSAVKSSPANQSPSRIGQSESIMSNVSVSPRSRPITSAEAMTIKANSAGELVMQPGGATGILRMTKPNVVVQEKVVILPPEPATGVKSTPPGLHVQLQQQLQQKSAFQTQQAVKIIGSGQSSGQPVPTIITPTSPTALKKVRAKKQTLGERVGVAPGGLAQPPTPATLTGQLTALTTAQYLSASPGTRIHGPVQTVQSLQTKVHTGTASTGTVAVRTAAPGTNTGTASVRTASPASTGTVAVRPPTTGNAVTVAVRPPNTGSTGMVRQASTPPKFPSQLQQRAASPAILTKTAQSYRQPRQPAPALLQSGAHYEIVTSTTTASTAPAPAQEFVVISQASASAQHSQPQQQFLFTSAPPTMPSPQAVAITSARRKSPVIKRAVPGPPIFKVPEVRPKPTAAVKPTLSEEEQLNQNPDSAKIRQALLAGQKTEKILTAEKVVHLLPIANPDGTVTYMLVQLDESGNMRLDHAEAAATHTGSIEPIYVESEIPAEKLLATIIQQNPAKESAVRKPPVKGTPVAPRAKVPVTQQAQSLVASTTVPPQPRQQLTAQPRQAVVGQQQLIQQQFLQIQAPTTTTHQYQSQAPAASSTAVAQKQTTVAQQLVQQRQVFVTQQQPTLAQHHLTTASTAVPTVTPTATAVTVPDLRNLQIQQLIQSTPTTSVSVTMDQPIQKPQQSVQAQDQIQLQMTQATQPQELQMPALIETKVSDAGAVMQGQLQQQPQDQQQQVHYVIQSQTGELGDIQGMNLEIPLEMQDYLQLVTGEDGNQYYVAPEGFVGADPNQQAYFQVTTTEGGENVTYDYSGLEGEQFYILQDDGTLIMPTQEVDIAQVLALQQQQLQLEQQEQQQQELQLQLQGMEAIGQQQEQHQTQPNV